MTIARSRQIYGVVMYRHLTRGESNGFLSSHFT